MYEPIMLCASCAKRYRDAKFDIVPVYSVTIKEECTLCRRPWGLAYLINRDKPIKREYTKA